MREVQFAPPLRAAAAGADHRFRSVRDDDVRSAARAGDQPGALRRRSRTPRSSPTRRIASPTCRSNASELQRPVVYHLLGRLSASPTYVISDEDMLEFICALQSEHLTPEKLFHELEHNHLLLIGSDFSNWLARLFLRMAKRRRLSDPRDVGEVFADDHTHATTCGSCRSCSRSACARAMFCGAEAFVAELHRRWIARQRPARRRRWPAAHRSVSCRRRARCRRTRSSSATRARTCPPCSVSRPRSTPPGSRPGSISTGSKAATTTTARSARNIARCSFFVPVISATTQRRHEALFPPRVELRGRSRAQHRRRRACSSCRSASTTRRKPTRWCRRSSRRCTSRACRAASRRRSSCAACRTCFSARRA